MPAVIPPHGAAHHPRRRLRQGRPRAQWRHAQGRRNTDSRSAAISQTPYLFSLVELKMKGAREAANGSIIAARRDTSFAATQAINDLPKVNCSYRTKKVRSSYSALVR